MSAWDCTMIPTQALVRLRALCRVWTLDMSVSCNHGYVCELGSTAKLLGCHECQEAHADGLQAHQRTPYGCPLRCSQEYTPAASRHGRTRLSWPSTPT